MTDILLGSKGCRLQNLKTAHSKSQGHFDTHILLHMVALPKALSRTRNSIAQPAYPLCIFKTEMTQCTTEWELQLEPVSQVEKRHKTQIRNTVVITEHPKGRDRPTGWGCTRVMLVFCSHFTVSPELRVGSACSLYQDALG